ncbi:molybdenum cofactor biosynthesis protein MoeA [Pseudomonas koreensis]|jgi:cell wall assembly regulator SMI1|uniref:SMI1/KNR4 family protein n=1 Tax=Pseudomonas koreensis TaxID=198620 RepID=UPI000984CC63|nr:SMI1/KNR4 family protein [Pseudomonas koreensis]OOH78163.1 molybdenum cofactor biosynthesis protein MoeA [Pseudomonas koreensis]
MTYTWQLLEASLQAHKPTLLADLNPPATSKALQRLQSELGVSLPEDFINALRGHDGQEGISEPLLGAYQWLSSARILDAWAFWKKQSESAGFDNSGAEPDPGVQDDWWNIGWIPFASNGSGDYLCLDLVPAAGGRSGQVISVWHDDGARCVVSESFSTWFARFF